MKKIDGWLLTAAIVFGLLLLYLLPDYFYGQYRRMPEEKITLRACGLKNEEALAGEVVLKYIVLDGKKADAADYVINGQWVTENGVLNWRNYEAENVTNEIVLNIPSAHSRDLVFECGEWRGICEMTYQGIQTAIDCWDGSYGERLVAIGGTRRYSDWCLNIIKIFCCLSTIILAYSFFNLWKKRTGKSIGKDLLAYLLLFIFVIWCAACHTDSPWSYRIPFVDSDVFLYGGWAMKQGEILYMDFWDHKGPYMYFLQWLGWEITNSYLGVWLLEVTAIFVSVAASYQMLRKRANSWLAFISVMIGYWYLMCYLSFGNYTETYTMPLISLSIMIFSRYFDRETEKLSVCECIVLGIMFMVVFLIRPNSISVWVVYCFVITVQCFIYKKYMNLGKYMFGFISGMGIAIFPVCIYMTFNHAWEGFIEFFTFNFRYVEAGGNRWDALGYFMLTPISILALVGILYTIYKKRRQRDNLETICLLGCYLLSMFFAAMAGATWNHYGIMVLPVLPIGILLVLQDVKKKMENMDVSRVMYISASMGIVIALICMLDKRGCYVFFNENSWTTEYSEMSDLDLKRISRRIQEKTDLSERISVFGNACNYYICSNRLSCSKYQFQVPLYNVNEAIGRDYITDLEEKRPAAIVVQKREMELENNTVQNIVSLLSRYYYLDMECENTQLYLLLD